MSKTKKISAVKETIRFGFLISNLNLTVATNKWYSPGKHLSQNPGYHRGGIISGEVTAKLKKVSSENLQLLRGTASQFDQPGSSSGSQEKL